MKLQTKLTLAFAVVALVPIAVLGGVARVVISNQYRGEFRRTLEHAENEVEREYQRLGDEVAEAVRRLARADDPMLGPLLVALAKGPLDDEHERDLQQQAEAQMRALGFDVLAILDERGDILAAAHHSGRVGDKDAAALALPQKGPPQLVEEQILDGGRARAALALESAREVRASFEGARHKIVVVGGRLLDKRFVERLHPGARLVGPGAMADTKPSHGADRGWPRTVVEFKRSDGTVAARVEIAIPDDELRRTLELIGVATAGLGLGGLALALLLGALVARRLTASARELAEGARAVARGQLDVKVPVRGKDELAELGQAFNQMIADLESAQSALVRAERIAAWREIAQRIAHEIKNPLTPIQMAIETLERAKQKGAPQFDALFDESARAILDEVQRLKHIVSEFSRFARMPAPTLCALDPGEVVEAALALYTHTAPSLERAIDRGLRAMADREQLTQVVLNLVENARDAVGEQAGGSIRVTVRASGARVEIEVSDTGPGLSDEVRAKLFTPYFTTKAKGTGLGLAIVHRIVTDHGGEIRVGGKAGSGAVFVIALPAA